MSVILIVKATDGIIVASDTQVTSGNRISFACDNKIMRFDEDVLIGGVGDVRLLNAIRHQYQQFSKNVDDILIQIDNLCEGEEMDREESEILVITEGRAYISYGHYDYRELTESTSLGTGGSLALGYYQCLEDNTIEPIDTSTAINYVKQAIDYAKKSDIYCGGETRIEILYET